MILKDKVCFITGSTRGIGWATAREFARQGAIVILNGRVSGAVLDDRCKELADESSGKVVGLAADVRDPAAVKGCYAEIFRRFRHLDVLVNNAGILQDALLGMISEVTLSLSTWRDPGGLCGHVGAVPAEHRAVVAAVPDRV